MSSKNQKSLERVELTKIQAQTLDMMLSTIQMSSAMLQDRLRVELLAYVKNAGGDAKKRWKYDQQSGIVSIAKEEPKQEEPKQEEAKKEK